MSKMTKVIRSFAIVMAAIALSATPALPQAPWLIGDYEAAVDAALPVLDPAILTLYTGPDWITLASVDVALVATGVGDLPAPGNLSISGDLTVARDAAQTKVIKIDLGRQRIRYISRARLFDFSTSSQTAVSEGTATSLVSSAMSTLQIPAIEQTSQVVDTVLGLSFDGPSQLEGSPYDRERLVTVNRVVNGFPVFGSIVRAAVSNDALIARLIVDWPQFLSGPYVTLRSRNDVVGDLAQIMLDAEQGEVVQVDIALGYVKYGTHYLPVARAGFTDLIDGTFGQLVTVPLVTIAPDQDLDSVPDLSDNCVERPNPGQEDFDADGIGDVCDNCPKTSNPGQEDANGDGTGNVCEPITIACNTEGILESSCEDLSVSDCLALGGTYQPNVATCSGDTASVPALSSGSMVLLILLMGIAGAAVILRMRRQRA